MMRPSRSIPFVLLAVALQAPAPGLEAAAPTDAKAAECTRSNQLFQHAEQTFEHESPALAVAPEVER